jgi:hypothetical protein
MVDVLGLAPKPSVVWQRQFDRCDHILKDLAACDWDAVRTDDLSAYLMDLNYMSDLQLDLFRHMFPACLKHWYETLMGDRGIDHGVEVDFQLALIRRKIVDRMLVASERDRLCAFLADGFLDRVEMERGFTYDRHRSNKWISRFNGIGLIAPVISRIWEDWWSMNGPGKAVSALKYASGLIYWRGENPIYTPWTPTDGGGGPYLTEWDGAVAESAWLQPNVTFLRSKLTPAYVIERMEAAVEVLRLEPEHAMALRLTEDARNRMDVIELRVHAMINDLASPEFDKTSRFDF